MHHYSASPHEHLHDKRGGDPRRCSRIPMRHTVPQVGAAVGIIGLRLALADQLSANLGTPFMQHAQRGVEAADLLHGHGLGAG